jgi:hypothetical protein
MPNGYFMFTFKGNRYHYRFHPANPSGHGQMRINYPRGALPRAELKNSYINVNVFAGTPRTKVTCQLDNGPEKTMERNVMEDPYFDKLVKNNPDDYLDWMNATCSPHIWIAPLPAALEPGLHRLKITARDHQGDIFTSYRLFEVTPGEK